MVTPNSDSLLRQAILDIRMAETELNRPDEDVVTLSACLCARDSIVKIMEFYLNNKAINYDTNLSIDDLHKKCLTLNSDFAKVDITQVTCRNYDHANCDGKYCLSTDSIQDCLSASNTLKGIVLNELKINESEFIK